MTVMTESYGTDRYKWPQHDTYSSEDDPEAFGESIAERVFEEFLRSRSARAKRDPDESAPLARD